MPLFIDQELQKLRSGMKSLVAANDEKVSKQRHGNLSSPFLVNTAVCDYAAQRSVCVVISLQQCKVSHWPVYRNARRLEGNCF